MSAHIYVAPTGAGKTQCIVERARMAARQIAARPIVCLPRALQVRVFSRRLGAAGGALGVRTVTFRQLHEACLAEAGASYVVLSDAQQYHLLAAILRHTPLAHYRPLIYKPGFVSSVQELIAEFKAARIGPGPLARAVADMGNAPPLAELAAIFKAYQEQLVHLGVADPPGLGWLAVEALEADPSLCCWEALFVDGFDNLTQVQIDLLRALAPRVGELVITLSSDLTEGAAGQDQEAYKRADATRERLQSALGVQAEPLPEAPASGGAAIAPALAHLRGHLYEIGAGAQPGGEALEFIEAPDQAAEAREALRWLKARARLDGVALNEMALLARDLAPYRAHIAQVAAEFGLPVRILGGATLAANPTVNALLDLLRLGLPKGDTGEPALPRRLVVEAWRSPYVDWRGLIDPQTEGASISPGDADALDRAAREGRVIAGLSQWREALASLRDAPEPSDQDEERRRPARLPTGDEAARLLDLLERMAQRLSPAPMATYREHVCWLEELIGDEPADSSGTEIAPGSLGLAARAAAGGDADVVARDRAALEALKELLRGLVWAEEALGQGRAVSSVTFFQELAGAVQAATYRPNVEADGSRLLVADVVEARGLPLRALALVGLAEGLFPAPLAEHPLLRDADRRRLRDAYGLALEEATNSYERGYLHETLARTAERLLITRPRLTDDGTPWEPSPFWGAIRQIIEAEPHVLTGEAAPPLAQVASPEELLLALATDAGSNRAWLASDERLTARLAHLDAAGAVFALRYAPWVSLSPFEGDLSILTDELADRYGPTHTWSASRLESYRGCPLGFFLGHTLGLEPRQEPAEGLDARQRGNIYHRILEKLYRVCVKHGPPSIERLLEALPAVAERVLDAAPQKEGFRVTAWWPQTRAEIVATVEQSVRALEALGEGWTPTKFEAWFGASKDEAADRTLVVSDGPDRLRIHGVVDRVDRDAEGQLRIIDYKTGGAGRYTLRSLEEGENLQLALYALAARDALGLGEPAEGFYWHVRAAKASGLKLDSFVGGARGAMAQAVTHAWAAVRGARAGRLAPTPPRDGCPSYCPGAAFCWRYRAGFGG